MLMRSYSKVNNQILSEEQQDVEHISHQQPLN
jgi:hypothetical protein